MLKKTTEQLSSIFFEYIVDDVWLSLNASDLWLPNISSMVKHYLAFQVLASLKAEQFSEGKSISDYAEFREFIERVYAALPSFSILEDYVPEMDWGAIKIPVGQRFVPIFYGSSVERVPDFVEAFRCSIRRIRMHWTIWNLPPNFRAAS